MHEHASWEHRPATPKQVAFLSYLGMARAEMTMADAHEIIEGLRNLDLSPYQAEIMSTLRSGWMTERFVLYPDLYADEFQSFLDDELPDALHTYVRGQVVGAAERLTKPKIREVIHSLTAEHRTWWKHPHYKQAFLERLAIQFPACCTRSSHPSPDSVPMPPPSLARAVLHAAPETKKSKPVAVSGETVFVILAIVAFAIWIAIERL